MHDHGEVMSTANKGSMLAMQESSRRTEAQIFPVVCLFFLANA